jgi:hypothetical protein
MVYTLEQRILILECFIETRSYTDTAETFAQNFPETSAPQKSSIKRLYDKFRTTGSVADVPRRGGPTTVLTEKVTDIQASITASPWKSLWGLSQQSGVSLGFAYTAVRKKLHLYLYKVRVVQELKPNDHVRRTHYWQWFMEHVTPDGEKFDDWYWTNEAWFHLNGYFSAQNTRIWSAENPHTLHEAPHHSQKVGVWTAVSQKRLFLTFFKDTVNSDRYMLLVEKFLTTLTDDEREKTWFQQDNATAHTGRNTMAFLKDVFPGRIISQGLWPARTPDLSPPDFFLWGRLKSVVYLKHPHTSSSSSLARQPCVGPGLLQELPPVFSIHRRHFVVG